MTAELRNLPHIASMAFNEPLMLEPAYARVFFCALAGQLGISRLTDAVSGDSLTAGEAPAALAFSPSVAATTSVTSVCEAVAETVVD